MKKLNCPVCHSTLHESQSCIARQEFKGTAEEFNQMYQVEIPSHQDTKQGWEEEIRLGAVKSMKTKGGTAVCFDTEYLIEKIKSLLKSETERVRGEERERFSQHSCKAGLGKCDICRHIEALTPPQDK